MTQDQLGQPLRRRDQVRFSFRIDKHTTQEQSYLDQAEGEILETDRGLCIVRPLGPYPPGLLVQCSSRHLVKIHPAGG